MIVFPQAKINLGLNVVRKRPDGYHDIDSVLVPIPLCDMLEAIVAPELGANVIAMERTGLPFPGDPEQDLCLRAVRLIQRQHRLPGLRMHLHKVIPSGAGLGGGSSDGARTLRLINDLLGLDIPEAMLMQMAGELGSDCPFFLGAGPQLAEGRGERLRPVDIDLRGKWIVLVNPGEHVPTAEVYRNTEPSGVPIDLVRLLQRPLDEWQGSVINGMEKYVLGSRPSIAQAKERLIASGADYCAMSGSGASVFALYESPPPDMTWPPGHSCWVFEL